MPAKSTSKAPRPATAKKMMTWLANRTAGLEPRGGPRSTPSAWLSTNSTRMAAVDDLAQHFRAGEVQAVPGRPLGRLPGRHGRPAPQEPGGDAEPRDDPQERQPVAHHQGFCPAGPAPRCLFDAGDERLQPPDEVDEGASAAHRPVSRSAGPAAGPAATQAAYAKAPMSMMVGSLMPSCPAGVPAGKPPSGASPARAGSPVPGAGRRSGRRQDGTGAQPNGVGDQSRTWGASRSSATSASPAPMPFRDGAPNREHAAPRKSRRATL